MVLREIISIIKDAKNIGIFPHMIVDGDTLGSSLALAITAHKMGKSVKVLVDEKIPENFKFLPGMDLIELYDSSKSNASQNANFDVGIAVDTADMLRLGSRKNVFSDCTKTINIDHHYQNTQFAQINYVSSNSAAVGEIIYQIIKLMGQDFDLDISLCLYVSLLTDTGGFRYSNTTSLTHQIASELIDDGVNPADVSNKLYGNVSISKIRLVGSAIGTLKIHCGGKVALMSITREMINQVGASDEDCNGLVGTMENLKGVEVFILIREHKDGQVKVNLRSKNEVDVSSLAAIYSGGGHKKAAGFLTSGNLEEIRHSLLKYIREIV